MLKKLIPKSEFSRNVLTLMTGTTIAQAIIIAISPILTRLYSPEDFGVYAFFTAITSIFGSIANGRYELAIMLPKKDEDAINITALGFIINVSLSLFLLFVIIIFHDVILDLLNNKEISPWLYFVPISVFLMGCFNLLNYFNNRKKYYKDLAKANVYKSIGAAVVQLVFGFLKAGAIGLVSGQIFSQFFANTKLLKNILKERILISKIKKIKMIALAKKYINHPKYLTFSHGMSTIYLQIPTFFITKFYDLTTLGFYSFANRIVSLPGSLIASSIGDVFRQRATEDYHKYKRFDRIFLKTFFATVKISLLPFIIIYFIVEDLFAFVFGEHWRIAGIYAKILIISEFFSFIITPVDKAALIVNNIGYILRWHIWRFIFYFFWSILSFLIKADIKIYLYGIVCINIFFYLIDFYFEYKFSKGEQI